MTRALFLPFLRILTWQNQVGEAGFIFSQCCSEGQPTIRGHLCAGIVESHGSGHPLHSCEFWIINDKLQEFKLMKQMDVGCGYSKSIWKIKCRQLCPTFQLFEVFAYMYKTCNTHLIISSLGIIALFIPDCLQPSFNQPHRCRQLQAITQQYKV